MKIYNTLTRKKEEFVPIKEGEVSIYVCGPTVYNFFHIGNARPFVVFDTLRKYLRYRGYKVKFVQNFTDVDDKIINRAREEGITAPEVSEKYIGEYFRDAAALNVKRPTFTRGYPNTFRTSSILYRPWSTRAMPMRPTATSIFRRESSLSTESFPNRTSTIWKLGPESQWAR